MRRRAFIRHPVLTVAIVAAVARLWVLAGVPLMILNDSTGYLAWGGDLANGRLTIPINRTPGYPLFLAAVFGVFGIEPLGVLFVQHALGVLTAALIAWITERRYGPNWGFALGLAAALSPSIMVWESYALTETLALALTVTTFGLAMEAGGGYWRGLGLGAALGIACLVRPGIELVIPFFAVGRLLIMTAGLKRRALAALAMLVGLAATASPWIWHNHLRGYNGLATGGSAVLWMGMAMSGAIDETYPLPECVQGPFLRLQAGPMNDERVHDFVRAIHGLSDPAAEALLGRWARASIMSRPSAYIRGAWRALVALTEVDRHPRGTDTGWALWRLSADGLTLGQAAGNFQISGTNPELAVFAMRAGDGSASRFHDWMSRHRLPGIPQVPLLACALIAGIVAVSRRRWGEASIMAGTGALFLIHAALLLPFGRYGLCAWVTWLMVFPLGVKACIRCNRHPTVTRLRAQDLVSCTPPQTDSESTQSRSH
jgi:4-amino-4-deoxy-L-arabinose transferase-like glycosyltransferase